MTTEMKNVLKSRGYESQGDVILNTSTFKSRVDDLTSKVVGGEILGFMVIPEAEVFGEDQSCKKYSFFVKEK